MKGERFNTFGLEGYPIVDMNLISPGIKPDTSGVLSLIVCVFHYNSQGSNPSNLLTARVRHKTSIHLHVLIADEIKGKVMFSLDSVA